MKSSIQAADNSTQNEAKIAATKSAIKRTRKELWKTEKQLNIERKKFSEDSIITRNVFNKLKTQILTQDLSKLRINPDGRKIIEMMDKVEKVIQTHNPQNSEIPTDDIEK